MQCTCMRDLEAKLAEHFSQLLKTDAKVECQSIAVTFSDSVNEVPRLIYAVTADKAGYRKGKETSFMCDYCPVCGKSVKPAEE